jgi:hypothetical protein
MFLLDSLMVDNREIHTEQDLEQRHFTILHDHQAEHIMVGQKLNLNQ